MYKGFVKQHVRKAICEMDIPLKRAIDFLKENPKFGIVEDYSGISYTLEELENAKNFEPEFKPELDNTVTGGEPLFEDTYRELLGTLADNSKSSPECDN